MVRRGPSTFSLSGALLPMLIDPSLSNWFYGSGRWLLLPSAWSKPLGLHGYSCFSPSMTAEIIKIGGVYRAPLRRIFTGQAIFTPCYFSHASVSERYDRLWKLSKFKNRK
jgi:hypothetical protein